MVGSHQASERLGQGLLPGSRLPAGGPEALAGSVCLLPDCKQAMVPARQAFSGVAQLTFWVGWLLVTGAAHVLQGCHQALTSS